MLTDSNDGKIKEDQVIKLSINFSISHFFDMMIVYKSTVIQVIKFFL